MHFLETRFSIFTKWYWLARTRTETNDSRWKFSGISEVPPVISISSTRQVYRFQDANLANVLSAMVARRWYYSKFAVTRKQVWIHWLCREREVRKEKIVENETVCFARDFVRQGSHLHFQGGKLLTFLRFSPSRGFVLMVKRSFLDDRAK